MKLLSTSIADQTVELVFASSDPIETASEFVSLRMPFVGNDENTLAYHQYWAVRHAIEALEKHKAQLGRRVDPNA